MTALREWDDLIAQMQEHDVDDAIRLAARIGRQVSQENAEVMALLEVTVRQMNRTFAEVALQLASLKTRVRLLEGGDAPEQS